MKTVDGDLILDQVVALNYRVFKSESEYVRNDHLKRYLLLSFEANCSLNDSSVMELIDRCSKQYMSHSYFSRAGENLKITLLPRFVFTKILTWHEDSIANLSKSPLYLMEDEDTVQVHQLLTSSVAMYRRGTPNRNASQDKYYPAEQLSLWVDEYGKSLFGSDTSTVRTNLLKDEAKSVNNEFSLIQHYLG